MKKNVLKLTAAVLAFSVVLTGCSGSGSSTAEKVDLNSMTLEEINEEIRLARLEEDDE